MKLMQGVALALLAAGLAGCGQNATKTFTTVGATLPGAATPKAQGGAVDEEAIKTALAKLGEIDREMAETQKFCAVQDSSRLGSMGAPVKITVKSKGGEDQDVWLCCKGCEKKARTDEAKTAARGAALYIEGNLVKLSPEDRKLVNAQKFCVVDNESELGAMGTPDKYVIKDKDGKETTVFVCCKGCIATIKKDEAKTLVVLEELKKKNGAKAEDKK